MAYKESVKNQELREYLEGSQYFWNINENVGYGYKNNPSDVMLVQFLLNACNRTFGFGNLLVPDGQFGGKTWREIKNFQNIGDTQTSDGCVTAVNGTKYTSAKTKTTYTILILNTVYFNLYRMYYSDIRKDPKIPEPLISQLVVPAAV